jgi:hypothetical protein
MKFGNPNGTAQPDPLELQRLVEIGGYYEAWVDALKLANYDLPSIEADTATRTVFVFEGGERTGQDANLIRTLQFALPFRPPTPFVEDCDQLTKHWTAGNFRQCARRLALTAQDRETETITLKDGTALFPRPVIFEVANTFDGPEGCVLDDLTLTRGKLRAVAVACPPRWRNGEMTSLRIPPGALRWRMRLPLLVLLLLNACATGPCPPGQSLSQVDIRTGKAVCVP